MLYNKAIGATASAQKIYIEDAFSTYLYTGNGSTQTITNGIDLSGKGGLVWIKKRNDTNPHRLQDTERGANKRLATNTTGGEITGETDAVTAFGPSGFTLGADTTSNNVNQSTQAYTSWTFRKAAKFFDVVTYTGTGSSSKEISHSLGSTPGCIIAKRTDSTGNWFVFHRSLESPVPSNAYILLNSTAARVTNGLAWGGVNPDSATFLVEDSLNVNGATYVAYLFAHDAGGFGDSGNDNVISCGSYTGTGTAGNLVTDLGWEPQWLLIKSATQASANWLIFDVTRGMALTSRVQIYPNLSDAEFNSTAQAGVYPLANGFGAGSSNTFYNTSGETYIYIAIRRGPMKTPTDATNVFQAKVYTGTNVDNRLVTTDILTDLVWARQRNDSVLAGMVVGDRLRGQPYLLTGSTAAEVNDADSLDQQIVSAVEYGTAFSSMTGFWVGNDATSKLNANTTSNNHVVHAFRRAPGFFDVVAYTGNGSSSQSISHNLGVLPNLVIVKSRSLTTGWSVFWGASSPLTGYMSLNSSAADSSNDTLTASSSSFTAELGIGNGLNTNAATYIAYLFATCSGVSKVGSYTGNGTTLDIDCGFTNGARFVLIKRTDAPDNWRVCDSTRGIVSGNDPILTLNTTFAEDAGNDLIDPISSGFTVVDTNYSNVNGATYIFLAVA